MNLNSIIAPRVRSMTSNTGLQNLEKLRDVWQVTAQLLRKARKEDERWQEDLKLPVEVGHMVLRKNHTPKTQWDPKYSGPYRVITLTATKAELEDVNNPHKERQIVHLSDLKRVDPAAYMTDNLPSYQDFGRAVTKSVDPQIYLDIVKQHASTHPKLTRDPPAQPEVSSPPKLRPRKPVSYKL